MHPRLRAVLDLMLPAAREDAGHHEYDGQVQDLTLSGVAAGLAALPSTKLGDTNLSDTKLSHTKLSDTRISDPHDDAHLTAFEEGLRVEFGLLQAHRRNPLLHLSNLELTCYERAYAPADERLSALRRHLGQWPAAVDMAVTTLDQVPSPVANALIDGVRGLAAGVPAELPEAPDALRAHERLVQHVQRCIDEGDPDTAIGADGLTALMGSVDAAEVDLGELVLRAEGEAERLTEMLTQACGQLRPGVAVADVVAELAQDYPAVDELIPEAGQLTSEVIEFTTDHELVTYLDGTCEVGLSPKSRRWATAMLSWAAPGEIDTPTRYDITPPEPDWPQHEQQEWLSMFNRASMLAITVHEVAPGHFAHSRALRRASGDVRRSLCGAAFAEGWAHYTEELMLEVGFRSGDPRYAAGVALEALCRLTRLTSAIGLHTGAMDVAEATQRFQSVAMMSEAVARSEAQRGTFDPGYGMYTWGKWEILRRREEARRAWGGEFSLRRFHDAMLELGSPPLGLLGTAVERG
ncbi:MAG TPA: DUF885 family protein [Actinomycetes bacterium]|nr:DUF885 family protein [Actinomycetes bacterium]